MDRLTELEVFKRVARLGSFTRAAESLGISRATVTRTIRLLESRLGVTLLSRTTRVVTLSATGSDFLLEAEELLARCDALYDHFKAASKELTGSLKVAASPAFSAFFVAQSLEEFQRLHPKLHLELVTHLDDLSASSLIEHRIDLACCVADTAPESVVAVRLGAAESFVCAAPGALARWGTPSTPEDIPPEAMIAGAHPDRWMLTKGRRHAALVPRGPLVLPISSCKAPCARLALRCFLPSPSETRCAQASSCACCPTGRRRRSASTPFWPRASVRINGSQNSLRFFVSASLKMMPFRPEAIEDFSPLVRFYSLFTSEFLFAAALL